MPAAGWQDFREAVVRPALHAIDHWSPAAENLLVGTAAVESGFMRLRQAGGGPALGIFQIEPATHEDIWDNYLAFRPELSSEVRGLASQHIFHEDMHRELVGNLFYATAIARIVYLRVKPPLPHADDLQGLADYWKAHYNTPAGAGKPAHFIERYATTV
jgi:hypothetical protein